MRVLREFVPPIEVYSIDESFLDLSGFGARLEQHSRLLRATVLQYTGIPVSVGVAPSKLLAKSANSFAKKDATNEGDLILDTIQGQDAALARMDLTDLWGVAGQMAKRMGELGVTTPLELKHADPEFMRERLGVVTQRMVLGLRGVSCLPLEIAVPDRKNIMASRSFGRPVTTKHDLEEAVSSYTARAAKKMRRQNLATASLIVFVETNEFRPQDAQYHNSKLIHLPVATADTAKLIGSAVRGLRAIWRNGYRYKKAGVMLLDLVAASRVQAGLFDAPDDVRSRHA